MWYWEDVPFKKIQFKLSNMSATWWNKVESKTINLCYELSDKNLNVIDFNFWISDKI